MHGVLKSSQLSVFVVSQVRNLGGKSHFLTVNYVRGC